MATRRLHPAILLAIPVLLSVAAYARAMRGEFVFDDAIAVERPVVPGGVAGVLDGFGPSLLHGGRPTTELTFAVGRTLAGAGPVGFHVGSLLLHLGVVLLVYVFTRAVLRLAGSGTGAGMAVAVAGIFALHPMQSESVSYVTQRAEVLASGLYLATLLVLLAADRRGPGAPGAALGVAAVALFTLGMGAKPILVTAPVAFLLLVALVPARAASRARWAWRLGLAAPLAVVGFVLARGTVQGAAGTIHAGLSVTRSDPGSYFLTQWRAVATYVRLLAWPAGQNADWSMPLSRSVGEPAVLLAGAFLTAMVAGAAALWWRSRARDDGPGADGRAAAYGVAWFFLVLAPTSSFVPIADVLVEHRVYLAAWGLFLAAVLGAWWLAGRLAPDRRGLAAVVLAGIAWLALAAALHVRNAVWESDLALWSDAVAKAPAKARPRLGLGVARMRRGQLDAAAVELARGLELAPADATGLRVALLHNLGTSLARLGRLEDAVPLLRQAAELDQDSHDSRQSLALALWQLGDAEGAEREARATLAAAPDSAAAARVMGHVCMARGDFACAIPNLERAVRAEPRDAVARYDLGAAYANVARTQEACASWRAVLTLRSEPQAEQAARAGMAALACPP